LICVISESDKHLFQFIYGSRDIQPQTVQPFLVDIWDISDSLNGFLSFPPLFDPGEGIDMSVGSSTHSPVFRVFLKNRLEVRHIFIDKIFQRNDDSLFRIAKQIIITHAGIKKSVRKISELGQCQVLFICKLICHKAGPVYMHIGLLDRKSTRLNSSHVSISYAVFCLKKKIFLPHQLKITKITTK